MKRGKLWLGLFSVGVLTSSILAAGTRVAWVNEMLINDALHLNGTKISNNKRSAYADEEGNLTDEGYARMISDSLDFCVKEEEQGAVLLKNNLKNGTPVLPLTESERHVTLFGRNSAHLCLRSGAGGAAPNQEYVINLNDAFEQDGFEYNKTVWNLYQGGSDPSVRAINESEVEIYTDNVKASFDYYSDVAIVTFVRVGTENSDPADKILDITDQERALLEMIHNSGKFKKTVVLLNGAMPMGLDWADDPKYGVDAILWFGVPGYYSLPGVVHILTGQANPSGHTPDTFASHSRSSAAYQNFGNNPLAGDKSGLDNANGYVVYKEGIYVGYKYYETRYEDVVLNQGHANGTAGTFNGETNWDYAQEVAYPFGYGLSYSTFEQKILGEPVYDAEKDTYTINVSVKNTSQVDGMTPVEVYVQSPFTDYDKDPSHPVEKSAIALMGYEKVAVKAGETVETSVSFDRYFMASYDHKGEKGYILEPGKYYFGIGNGAHEALNNILHKKAPTASLYDHLGAAFTANDDGATSVEITAADKDAYKKSHYDSNVTVTNQFDDADVNYWCNDEEKIVYLTRTNWEETFPTKQETLTINSRMKEAMKMNTYKKPADAPSYTEGKGTLYSVQAKDAEGNNIKIKFSQMAGIEYDDNVIESGLLKGLTGKQAWDAFIKQMSLKDLSVSMTDNRGIGAVVSIGKPTNSIAEGPEGLLATFQYGDKRSATGFATGPIYTATWDHNMQKKFGFFYGEEALFAGVACVNAPGANINRTPYGSRASEYMSEDGVMNYLVASNIISEAGKKGLIMNVKHCFLNNQETNRQGVATFANEQSIREIYLRPFEGALTKGKGLGIMTSYNRIGLTYAACHSTLMNQILRTEWGYKGQIIDDALGGSNYSTYSNGPAMTAAGTNIFCLDGNRGSQLISYVEENDDGNMLKIMQTSNRYIMYSLVHSWMGDAGAINEDDIAASEHPWWKTLIIAIDVVAGVFTLAALGLYVTFDFILKTKGEN